MDLFALQTVWENVSLRLKNWHRILPKTFLFYTSRHTKLSTWIWCDYGKKLTKCRGQRQYTKGFRMAISAVLGIALLPNPEHYTGTNHHPRVAP